MASVHGSTLQAMTAAPPTTAEHTFTNPATACDGDEGIAGVGCRGAVTVGLIESGRGEVIDGANEKVRIPRQLWRMVEALMGSRAYQQPGLFVEKGVELEVQGIQEAIEGGSDFPEHCAHSMVEVRERAANLSPEKWFGLPRIRAATSHPQPFVTDLMRVSQAVRRGSMKNGFDEVP